jgi:HlyD family secretion protein
MKEQAQLPQLTRDDIAQFASDTTPPGARPKAPITAALIVTVVVVAIVGLSLWYLVQPQPLLVQGEADARRIDIAARVDGRVSERPVDRGQNVTPGQLLIVIDNPELVTKLKQAEAAQAVAGADLARIMKGTRQEVVNARRAAVASAEAQLKLQQQNYDRTRQLAEKEFARSRSWTR